MIQSIFIQRNDPARGTRTHLHEWPAGQSQRFLTLVAEQCQDLLYSEPLNLLQDIFVINGR